jgi:hypothetical protein
MVQVNNARSLELRMIWNSERRRRVHVQQFGKRNGLIRIYVIWPQVLELCSNLVP